MPLPHVEWGEVLAPISRRCRLSIRITRVGIPVSTAIRNKITTKDRIYEDVAAGVAELHGLGLAHCDIHMGNVFVDEDGTAFLGDLEFLAPMEAAPRDRARRALHSEAPSTSELLDELQLSAFQYDLFAL